MNSLDMESVVPRIPAIGSVRKYTCIIIKKLFYFGTVPTILANSLVYPERIQRGIEWTQFLKRVFFVCLFIGQLPRVSREDPERIRVDSVFETFTCSLHICQQIFSFSLFQPSLFIQYSTEECSTVQVFIWCLDTIA